MPAIKVENLTKIYKLYNSKRDRLKESIHPFKKKYSRDFYALKDVSFEIKKGETIGIIGKNGSGKSTLLKMITGIITPTAGSIEVNGKVSALLELGAGFNPEYTGIENIYLNGTIMGFTLDEMNQKLDSIVKFADIGDFVYQPVKMYSSGMYVRLAFAVAINVEPNILIIDEALAVGDIRFQIKCHRKLEEFREKGKTILFVSHSTSDVVRLCDRTVWLDDGKIKKIGKSKEIAEEYHAWMAHDTGLVKKEQQILKAIGSTGDESNLTPIAENALITGEGGAVVEAVGFFDEYGRMINVLDGRKKVNIVYRVVVKETLYRPYFSFQIINSKGLILLGSNTYVLEQTINKLEAGQTITVKFQFAFPEIENGEYVIATGIADGTPEKHIRHQMVADAFLFSFNSNSLFQKQAPIYKLNDCNVDINISEGVSQ